MALLKTRIADTADKVDTTLATVLPSARRGKGRNER